MNKSWRKYLFIALITFLPGSITLAQQPLSLMEAIQVGLDNNFSVRISEQSLEIAKNNNAWGAAGMWPAITLGINLPNRYTDSPSTVEPDERNKAYTSSFVPNANLNWTIFRGFSVQLTKQQLALLENLTEGNATVVIENTIQGVMLSYYKVLLDQEKLRILGEVKQLSGDRYNYMMYKKELGSAVTYEVLQAENSYLADSSNYLLQELNLLNSMLVLKLLLGVSPDNQYELTDDFEVITYDLELDTLLSAMLSNNTTIRNQYINQEILKRDIKQAQSNLWPSLVMNAGIDHYNNRIKYVDNDPIYTNNLDYYVNFSVNFNLSNGGNTRRAIQNAKINEIIGEIEIDEMEQSLSNYMVNQFELYNIRKQLYDVAMAGITSNQLNLEISTEKYRSGAINSFNFRDVQLQYLNAAFKELEAIYDLIDTHTEILRLTGGIISQI